MTQEEKDRNARALSLRTDRTFNDAVEMLKSRAVKALLSAKTPEDREEKWRDYDAFERVVRLVGVWAEEARQTPE